MLRSRGQESIKFLIVSVSGFPDPGAFTAIAADIDIFSSLHDLLPEFTVFPILPYLLKGSFL
jgi:hypothetical protein